MNTGHTTPAKNPTLIRWAILASLIAIGAALALTIAPSAVAQADKAAAPPTPRYQVFAWAYPSDVSGGSRGCYIIDTYTGELWGSEGNNPPKKIAEKLK